MYDFVFKPFDEMTPSDYERVGFKSGLEIHQQLDTGKKLFCRCIAPKAPYSDDYHAEILRHMRPTLSELGEYDGTALMEFKTKKEIIYRINRDTICTYEMDDTPPFEINDEALEIALEIGLLMNAKIVDELHIARKQYLDGSIPTGFQRTAIFCVNGWIPFKNRRIDIVQMSIEEDACREVSDFGHTRTYLTDRLGVPLVETVTAPQMYTPFEVADVCDIIRKIARSTGKVRTGIGAARQDVNVSVTGGTRIEIKGVPKITRIPLLTYNEAMRQWNLLRLREELHRRGIKPENFKAKWFDVTKILRNTHYFPISRIIQMNGYVRAVLLEGWAGLLKWQTQMHTVFAKEISDRVRVIACLTTLPNLIHSDSLENTISKEEYDKVSKQIGATRDDVFVIVWADNEDDIQTAVNEIIIRAKEATIGVPSETRQAMPDGTTGFERILPGPDRMYPDTDLPPKKIDQKRIEKIKLQMPKPYWERMHWYETIGVPKQLSEELSLSRFADLFEVLVLKLGIDPKFAAISTLEYPKKLAKLGFDSSKLTAEIFVKLFSDYKDKKIVRDCVFYGLKQYLEFGKIDKLPNPIDDEEFKHSFDVALNEVSKMVKEGKIHNNSKLKELIISKMMYALRYRVEGEKVYNYVEQYFKGLPNDKQ
ncbi:MAG: Glu-tRNA(Gln) amidotransferase subunit GatE [Candidatus Kapaibacteriales bacterium]